MSKLPLRVVLSGIAFLIGKLPGNFRK